MTGCAGLLAGAGFSKGALTTPGAFGCNGEAGGAEGASEGFLRCSDDFGCAVGLSKGAAECLRGPHLSCAGFLGPCGDAKGLSCCSSFSIVMRWLGLSMAGALDDACTQYGSHLAEDYKCISNLENAHDTLAHALQVWHSTCPAVCQALKGLQTQVEEQPVC